MNQTSEKKITVVFCEPEKPACIKQIGADLKSMQKAVGGLIEPCYPFEEEVCIVCNEEGKINGMSPNRAVYGERKEIIDIVFGPFFLCDCSGDEFASLSEEQQKRYLEMFKYPEQFYNMNGRLLVRKNFR